jgi:superfamily II DNA or RNA helicase
MVALYPGFAFDELNPGVTRSFKPNMSTTLANFEFHRQGIGLVPAAGQGQEGSAIFVELPSSTSPLRSCTCEESRRKTCSHLKELAKGVKQFEELYGSKTWNDLFVATRWHRLMRLFFDGSPLACNAIRVAQLEREETSVICVTDSHGNEVARYLDPSSARIRFLERTGKAPTDGVFTHRSALLDRLYLFQASPEERQLNKHGMKTNRQSWEESFWYRLAYHCTREFGIGTDDSGKGFFHPAVDRESGDFCLTFRYGENQSSEKDHDPNEAGANPAILKLIVPRSKVGVVLNLLREEFPEQPQLRIHPVPLQTIFRTNQDTELDMLVRPVIRTLQVKGQRRFYGAERARFRYGLMTYVRELRVLAELEEEGSDRKFRPPQLLRLQRSLVPNYTEIDRQQADEGSLILAQPLRGLEIFKDYDHVQVTTETLERSWFWMSVKYSFGDQDISLEDILNARHRGLPYLETPQGWIDLNSPRFDDLERLAARHKPAKGEPPRTGLRLSASELLRFQATTGKPLKVKGRSNRAAFTRRLLELRPSAAYTQPKGFISELREYQKIGAEWLNFLFENRIGGLLCDDMGLGKTHQAMALMAALRESGKAKGPYLVVCPTSVISHWRNKIRDFAPGLTGFEYHGPERDFAEALRVGDVIITSYGILRNDQMEFGEIDFPLAIFDEIQHIKNRDTLGYEAAESLGAEVKIGMTGTPIENSIDDLKTLFDLILPGYLGSDQNFAERFNLASQEGAINNPGLDELRRLISPFVLRRLKSSVLDELPEKIEATRTCDLSDDQVNLYRRSSKTRGAELVDRIRHSEEPLPYIHIFALLNYLKQICDHPALALKAPEDANKYRSGKWDLYTEIMQECLDAGLKVVVFTQYLGMITLMANQLKKLKVGYVTLTGASTSRGDIIDKFNEDPSCRVFLGSLKAGGTGIDLVGGSVVIHYDRWWNAAREDQATDRVHRIGQKRAVQVFKLVTEGTLEEKIGAIIERKRELMQSVVQEDDPHLSKIFSREELLSMLAQV